MVVTTAASGAIPILSPRLTLGPRSIPGVAVPGGGVEGFVGCFGGDVCLSC